ncbi:radical SAM protein [Anaerosalibacter massiliensis]|uniref:Radical SAM protein n=1 Tax=Anaerosalibacter massiliensis TaxID=1347392 RepID=A0A9X2MDT3_9FIRM|nr:radical SAM protein [Anaerosalibacter massiliensis]MCR2043147.1 radical SAM protein [Anaerosalibacter massiliensis]
MKFTIFVTSKCNLRCRYCYEGTEKSNIDMTTEISDKVIEFIKYKLKEDSEKKPLNIIFHGGEPLINFELIKYISGSILQKIKDREVIFSMTTNGTIMTEEIIEYVKEYIDSLSISIDGTLKSHDMNRKFANGEGSYKTVIYNARKLLSGGIDLRARMTFNSQNVRELYEGVKIMADLGFRYIVPAIDYYDELWDEAKVEVLREQVNRVSEIKNKYPNTHISLVERDMICKKKGDCFGGVNGYSIDPKGNLYPCAFCVGNDEFILGNIYSTEKLDDNLPKLYEISQIKNQDCLGCSAYEYCDGVRCKFLNKVITGEYNVPPPILCAMKNILFRSNNILKGTF